MNDATNRYYMIFYRPKGSKTFTPVGEFHGMKANIFMKSYNADKEMSILSDKFRDHEFEVYVCKPVEWCVVS